MDNRSHLRRRVSIVVIYFNRIKRIAKAYLPLTITGTIFFMVLISFIFVAIRYRNEIIFVPWEYINKGVEYLIGGFLILLGFLFSDVYWAKKVENQETSRQIIRFLFYLNHASKLVWSTNIDLSKVIYDIEESTYRDQEVIANLRRLGDCEMNISKTIEDSGIYLSRNWRALKAISYYTNNVADDLRKLSSYPSIRLHITEIQLILTKVGSNIHQLIKFLTGVEDELN
jgi:hypothetical protein